MRTKSFMLGALGAVLVCSQAMAVFIPPSGDIKFKLTDGSNVYSSITGDTGSPDARQQITVAGEQDFTEFRFSSYTIGSDPTPHLLPGTVTGIVSFLQVKANASLGLGINVLQLEDSTRPHQLAGGGIDPVTGNPTIGRFFLFDTSGNAGAGNFGTAGGQPADVDFSTGLGDQRVSSNGVNFFDIDGQTNFTNFTDGGDLTTNTLLATGSIVALADGTISDVTDFNSPPAGVFFTGSIGTRDLVIDGGLWYDMGLTQRGTFQINQIGYLAGLSSFPNQGDQNVFDGGWQVSSEDPVHVQVTTGVPEPATAGLGLLVLGALGFYARRRRA